MYSYDRRPGWKVAGVSGSIGPEVADLLRRHPLVEHLDTSLGTGSTETFHIDFTCKGQEGSKTLYSLRLADMGQNAVLRLERRGSAGVMLKMGIQSSWSAQRVFRLIADKLEYWHG